MVNPQKPNREEADRTKEIKMAKPQKIDLIEALVEAEKLTWDPGFLSTNHPAWKIIAGALKTRYTLVDAEYIFDVSFDEDTLHDMPEKAVIQVRCGNYQDADAERTEYTIPFAALQYQLKIFEAEQKIAKAKKKLDKIAENFKTQSV